MHLFSLLLITKGEKIESWGIVKDKELKVDTKTNTVPLTKDNFEFKTKFESKSFVKPEINEYWVTSLMEDNSNLLIYECIKLIL